MRTRDLASAGVVVAATVVPVALTAGWQAIALAVVASAPVLWVYRRPLPVGLVVGFATTALAMFYVAPVVPAGPLVALYVIAASSPPAWTSFARTGNPGWPEYRYGRVTRIWDTPSSLAFAPREAQRAAWDGFDFRFFQ